nr:PABP1-DEPENDENT POLY [Haemonchus contortus]CDJ80211.1 PAB-dependent Poly(A) specific ribonuclease [Haemonchus contortus]
MTAEPRDAANVRSGMSEKRTQLQAYCTGTRMRKKRMQTADGFGLDGGPPVGAMPPPGSRLAKYLGGNRTGGSTGLHLNANVPTFIPHFAQLGLGDMQQPPPPGKQTGSHSPFTPHRAAPPFHPGNASSSANHADALSLYQENHGGTTYFYPHQQPPQTITTPDSTAGTPRVSSAPIHEQVVPENHTVVNTNGSFSYQGPVPHIGKFRPKSVASNNMAQFISPDVKMELVHRQLAMEARADPIVYPDLPQQVEHFNQLVPLEQINQHHATQSVFKAVSIRDGVTYCIRRLHGFRISSPKQLQPLETWKKLVNVNVVQLREVIANCKAFGDSSVILVYDYHPLADSLKTRHFGRMLGSGFIDGITGAKMSSQLTGHASNQMQQGAGVVECVDLSKILVHGKSKILLSCGGVADLLAPDTQVQQLQMEDLHALGRVLLALATGNAFSARRDLVQQSMTYVTNHYSSDMKNLISFLLSSSPTGRKSINEIMPMIGARFYSQLETAQMRNDMLENELSKELENGRLFRILSKINTIVERPEHNLDPTWSETGDRFLIKLFRDYVFHQVTESGKPWMDMAHIVQCLNKLDAGVSEKVQLVSRDGNNLIVVSYGDLRRCLETAFRELIIYFLHDNVVLAFGCSWYGFDALNLGCIL